MQQKAKYRILKDQQMIMPTSPIEREHIKNMTGQDRAYRVLFQIQAVQDFETSTGEIIKAGTLGGYIQSVYNLNPFDKSWLGEGSVAIQNAQVTNDSYVGRNVTCCWAFRTPKNSYLDANHQIIVDHYKIYSTKDKCVVGYTGQDNAIEELQNHPEIEQEARQWQAAVTVGTLI